MKSFIVAAVTLLSVAVHAESLQHCNGYVLRWREPPRLHIDVCTVTGVREMIVAEMVAAWNRIGGTDMRIESVHRGRCGARYGDGESTVAFVPSASIDGALGLTLRRYSGRCGPWTRDWRIIEADVLINADDPPLPDFSSVATPPDCDVSARRYADVRRYWRSPCCDQIVPYSVRNTVLHEVGHFLGLGHYDDEMAVMMRTEGEGRVCGSTPWGPMPDDVDAVRRLYGRNRQTIRDVSASSHRWIAPNRIRSVRLAYPPDRLFGFDPEIAAELAAEPFPHEAAGQDYRLCAGELVPVQYSVANRGTVPGRYRVKWYASPDRTWSQGDVLLGTSAWRGAGPGTFSTVSGWLRASRRLDAGVAHRLVFVLEPSWGFAGERRAGDNAGVLPGTVTRLPDGECR